MGGSRRQVTGSRDGQPRAPAGLHPPEQLNSLFWTSATLRPRRLAGPAHWVKSPMVGLCLSHCESQARWQSQSRWLECRRLQRDRATHNSLDPGHRVGTPLPRGSEPRAALDPSIVCAQSARSSTLGTIRSSGEPPSGCPFVPACLGLPLGWILSSSCRFTSLNSNRPTAPSHITHFQTQKEIIGFPRKNQI